MNDNGNFISRFIRNAKQHPDKVALQLPFMEGQKCLSEEVISYGDLSKLVLSYQALWKVKGWQPGDRVIVILKPSKELYAIALALLSLGIVAVFIDTGMGRKKIQMAIRDSNAKAIISMQALVKLFWFVPSLWPLQRFAIDGAGLGYKNLSTQVDDVAEKAGHLTTELSAIKRSDTDHGLISFTSGSTGRPKGADRTHFSLIQQHLAIRDHWPDEEGDIDCPCFPVMVLHNLSCGMTTIMPKVDLAEPSQVKAEVVIAQLRQHKISRLSGAPAYIEGLVTYLNQQPSGLDTVSDVKSLVVGGATVSKALAQSIKTAFPEANARVVYGSTEAEPISDVSLNEYLAEETEGYLVGHVAQQIDLLISNISGSEEHGVTTEEELFAHRCKAGEVGEILVSGHHVLKQYIDNPAANRENKIPRKGVEATKSVWHRTGDCGYQDQEGRLWLSGRIKDVLSINGHLMQPFPIEQKLDQDESIKRAAIIQHDGQVILFIQALNNSHSPELIQRITLIAAEYFSVSGINSIQYIEMDSMPVDGRHNSKIDRPFLREYLTKNMTKTRRIISIGKETSNLSNTKKETVKKENGHVE